VVESQTELSILDNYYENVTPSKEEKGYVYTPYRTHRQGYCLQRMNPVEVAEQAE